ncbi:MAG TPA: hypothetical protein VJ302_28875 [Blastocatellia bacterium]|nr:hypothetical protein [Blastocatellia bacterium]
MPSTEPHNRVEPEELVAPRRVSRIIWAMVLTLIVGGVIASGLIIEAKRRQVRETATSGQALQSIAEPAPAPTAAPSPTPYWASDSRKVGGDSLAIPPGQFYSFPFEIESEWRQARLTGKYSAQGGQGNDVEVVITNDDGLINYGNDHEFRSWYSSGQLTTDTVSVPLPPGKFNLIVSNKFSIISHKSVTMGFQVEYEYLKQP